MKAQPKDIDGYMATVSPEGRKALEKLRMDIQAAVPDAVESIYYGLPAFRHRGKWLLAFAAFKAHCSLFPGGALLEKYKADLKGYSLSKGTLRFPPDKPLPTALVKKLVKARIAQIESREAR